MLSQLNSRRRFRSSTHRANLNPRRSFESLEPRQVMAGNITAVVDAGGNLVISGDDLDNGLYITQSEQGEFLITGLNTGVHATTINGSTNPLTLKNVTGAITINTGAGNDLTQFDYFNHTGNLTIRTNAGYDTVNLGTSNAASKLVGDLFIEFTEPSTANLLNASFEGVARLEHTGNRGPAVFVTFPPNIGFYSDSNSSPNELIEGGYFPPNTTTTEIEIYPPPCSFAITGCTFSSNLKIGTNLRDIQVFIESTQISGNFTIENAVPPGQDPQQGVGRSFVILNNVTALKRFSLDLYSSASVVINSSTFGAALEPIPADTGVTLVPTNDGFGSFRSGTVTIGLFGKQNILQMTDTTIHGELFTRNRIVSRSVSIGSFPTIIVQSDYDVYYLNNVDSGRAEMSINGAIRVKDSTFADMFVHAKKSVMLERVTAEDATLKLTGTSASTRTSINDSTFENLTIAADHGNMHDFNVQLTDSEIAGFLSIEGRGGFDYYRDNVLPLSATIRSSTAEANVVIDQCEIGILYYSYTADLRPDEEGVVHETRHSYYGGSGTDDILIRESTINIIFAQLGAGDDTITFEESHVRSGSVDGSEGYDRFIAGDDSPMQRVRRINFEEGNIISIPADGQIDFDPTIILVDE